MRCGWFFLAAFLLSPIGITADIYVPDHHSTIQDASNAAVDGDTVIVRPGTYVENIDFIGKAITVTSEIGPDVTAIDGNRNGSVVTFRSGEGPDSVLEGFLITNGSGSLDPFGQLNGGGIFCDQSSPLITKNRIEGNKTEIGGGLSFINDSEPLVRSNLISGNFAECGGGIHFLESTPTITENSIMDNVVSAPNLGSGGGIMCHESAGTIADNRIEGNMCEMFGGGIRYTKSTLLIQTNLIRMNQASIGSGIYTRDCSDAGEIADNRIIENGTPGSGSTGGIICDDSEPLISGNLIAGNAGRGFSCLNRIPPDDPLLFIGNTVSGNGSSSSSGGGIKCSKSSLSIVNCLVFDNYSSTGGAGIHCKTNSQMAITNCTITRNSTMDTGGGIQLLDDSIASVKNTILWDNSAFGGPEIWLGDSHNASTLFISYSDVEDGQSSCHTEPNCILDWGAGMIDADPLFVDRARDDFHLPFDSPCRSAGDRNAPWLPDIDFEGDPRTGLFAFPDIGADEFHTHFYVNGAVSTGGSATGVIIGWPKTNPVLIISGSGVLPTPDHTPFGDFWLLPPWNHRVHFNPMPDNGVRLIDRVVSTGLPPGTKIPLQALVGTDLSNLWIVEFE